MADYDWGPFSLPDEPSSHHYGGGIVQTPGEREAYRASEAVGALAARVTELEKLVELLAEIAGVGKDGIAYD